MEEIMKMKLIESYMKCAEAFAECSSAQRLKVGAIVVDPHTNAIISVGYNGTLPGQDNCCEYKVYMGTENVWLGKEIWLGKETITDWPYSDNIGRRYKLVTKPDVLHAEENAISKLAKSSISSDGCYMFCTHSPCIQCARLMIAAGISRVYYKEQFRGGSISCGIPLLKKLGIETRKV
jgi:dCMP deaminase